MLSYAFSFSCASRGAKVPGSSHLPESLLASQGLSHENPEKEQIHIHIIPTNTAHQTTRVILGGPCNPWVYNLLQIITYIYIYTNYICYQIFVLSPCAHMDLPSSPLSIRNIIISEIRCSGVEWSSILSFHVCKKKRIAYDWKPRHLRLAKPFPWPHVTIMSPKWHCGKKHVTLQYVTYLFAHVCTIHVLLAAQTCNNRTFLYK